jgi:PhnB protein
MARTSTYLNFTGQTEAAFTFYKRVFGTDFNGAPMRMRDAPAAPGMPPLRESEKNLIMHVELPIVGGHVLMGTDVLDSMGHKVVMGSNVSINLEPDSRAEAERLFAALAEDGKISMPLADMFWGALYGSLTDKFGVQWMVNCAAPKS